MVEGPEKPTKPEGLLLELLAPRSPLPPLSVAIGVLVFFLMLFSGPQLDALTEVLSQTRLGALGGPVGTAALALIAFSVSFGLYRALQSPPAVHPIIVGPRMVIMPPNPRRYLADEVPFSELTSVEVHGQGDARFISLVTRRRRYVFPQVAFVREDGLDLLARAVRARLAMTPEGRAQLSRMGRRDMLHRQLWSRRPVATYGLLASIAIVYLIQHRVGAFDGSVRGFEAMLRVGANAAGLVAEGEWFRLITANFMHGAIPGLPEASGLDWLLLSLLAHIHILLNAVGLYSLGGVLERLVGSVRWGLIFIISAISGAAASVLFSQAPLSVGASGGLFGLLGAFAVLHLRFADQLPTYIRQTRVWWVVILGINIALPLQFPMIDVAAHAGGMVVGMIVALAVLWGTRDLDTLRAPGAISKALAGLLAGLVLAAFVQAYLTSSDGKSIPKYVKASVSQRDDAYFLNFTAWFTAIDPKATRPQLELAVIASKKAVELEPDRPEHLDTLATAHYRLGHVEEAVKIQRQAIDMSDRPVYWTQLARFVHGHLARKGMSVLGDVEPGQVKLTITSTSVEAFVPQGEGNATIIALIEREDRRLGTLRVPVSGRGGVSLPIEGDELRVLFVKGVQLRVGRVEIHEDAPKKLQFIKHDKEVDPYPGMLPLSS